MLLDLSAQESARALERRLRHYARPHLLCIDEVGYLSSTARAADLLFEVITRRYDNKSSIIHDQPRLRRLGHRVSERDVRRGARRPPHAPRGRRGHRGDSYRRHEAEQRRTQRKAARSTAKSDDHRQLVLPPDLQDRPQLAVLSVLDAALQQTVYALLAAHPELQSGDTLDACAVEPAAWVADALYNQITALTHTLERYRQAVADDGPRSSPAGPNSGDF